MVITISFWVFELLSICIYKYSCRSIHVIQSSTIVQLYCSVHSTVARGGDSVSGTTDLGPTRGRARWRGARRQGERGSHSRTASRRAGAWGTGRTDEKPAGARGNLGSNNTATPTPLFRCTARTPTAIAKMKRPASMPSNAMSFMRRMSAALPMGQAKEDDKKLIRPFSAADVKSEPRRKPSMLVELKHLPKMTIGSLTAADLPPEFIYDDDESERHTFADQTQAQDAVAEFHERPYPCGHSGCHNFHSDLETGLCPDHSGGAGGGGGRFCGLCHLSVSTVDRMQKQVNLAKVVFMTIGMGVVESNDKVSAVTFFISPTD